MSPNDPERTSASISFGSSEVGLNLFQIVGVSGYDTVS
jgi:hypothetical protein